jgi:hypothetical protein
MKFHFRLEETASEAYKVLIEAWVTMPWQKTRYLSGFLNSNIMILKMKNVCSSIMPSETTQNKTWRKFGKSSMN